MAPEIDPPLLTRTASYEQWKLETRAWTLITDLSREKQAIAVALHLPTDHESKIKEKVFEQLELEELQKESGLSTLFDFLDKHLQKDRLTDILEKFEDFENYKRKDGQSMHEYVCLFDFKYKKIDKLQINLPPEILAFRLLQGANISRQEQLIILTRIDYEKKATMYEEAKTMLKRFAGCKGAITWCSSRREESKYKLHSGGFVNIRRCQPFHEEKCRTWTQDALYPGVNSRVGYNDRKARCKSDLSKSGIKKKVNPTGLDGKILKCLSCGSYRHLLNHCPDSWENMRKKLEEETPEKSSSQSEPGKKMKSLSQSEPGKKMKSHVGSHIEDVIAKLTQELANLKEDNKSLRNNLRLLQLPYCSEKPGSSRQLELHASHGEAKNGEECTSSLESRVQKLNQVLSIIEKRNSILDRKLKGLEEKIENTSSELKSQNESLFSMIKNQALESLLIAEQIIETSSFQKKLIKQDLLDDYLNEQRKESFKHWRTILSELEHQIKSPESAEETTNENQSRCGTIPDGDSGVARMMLQCFLKGKAAQMIHQKIRMLHETRDSDHQIMRRQNCITQSEQFSCICLH